MKLSLSVALAILLGAFSVLGWDPFGWWMVSLLGYAGLFWLVVNSRTAWRAGLLGLVFGVGLHLFGSGWIFGALHGKAGMGLIPAMASTLVFVVYLALFTALPCLSWRALFKSEKNCAGADCYSMPLSFAAIAAFPALLTLGEWARSLFFNGFTSLSLGYSLIDTWLA
ncbi:MAG: hypothetical protein Q8R64_10475, partial [Sulfurimicrobium sp.]|nr:hypothetical protein [Sulfurimicrobium sp.]